MDLSLNNMYEIDINKIISQSNIKNSQNRKNLEKIITTFYNKNDNKDYSIDYKVDVYYDIYYVISGFNYRTKKDSSFDIIMTCEDYYSRKSFRKINITKKINSLKNSDNFWKKFRIYKKMDIKEFFNPVSEKQIKSRIEIMDI